ncbi:MAG TPA: hypothetical protein VN616_02420 [Puia sp.]|nr:hypothetical protein [Puia sp.]
MKSITNTRIPALLAGLLICSATLRAQTDDDAIMMAKKNLCTGFMYSHSSWNYYWEGTYHRNNPNLGTVTTQMAGLMAIYGITPRLNVIANVPYVWTDASAGVLHAMHGIQDLSAWLKWEALRLPVGEGKLKVFAAGGASTPLTAYLADYLPLSIGLRSRTLSGRVIVDYQLGHFFATATGTYTWRSNITIDEQSYYTTSFHETNQVQMPDMTSFVYRAGYRGRAWDIQAVFSGMVTIGGFDIRRNDMLFPSNRMNAAMAGAHVKYEFPSGRLKGLSFTADGSYTVAGRNVGQSTMLGGGIFYTFDFSRHLSTTSKSN